MFKVELKKKETSKPSLIQPSTAFEADSDEEKGDASERFDKKYANLKAKDERLVQKILEENPDAYKYDEVFDEIERQKNEKTAEQKNADVEKKPKYAHLILNAHKKREADRQLHEERSAVKERKAEAGEFEDKEEFVTGAYREKLEEARKRQEEIDREERIDELTKVENQKLWQQSFNRKLLNDISRGPADDGAFKEEPTEENAPKPATSKPPPPKEPTVKKEPLEAKKEQRSIYSDESEEEDFKPPARKFGEELKPGLNRPKLPEVKQEVSEREQRRHHRRHDSSDRRHRRDRDDRSHSRHDSRRSRGSASPDVKPERRREHEKARSKALDDEEKLRERMNKVREILARRNGEDEIAAMRKRYFERKADGGVPLPV